MHREESGEYVPYHQFGVRGGGRFSMSNPKTDVDWKIYRARQVSVCLPPPSAAACQIMYTVRAECVHRPHVRRWLASPLEGKHRADSPLTCAPDIRRSQVQGSTGRRRC